MTATVSPIGLTGSHLMLQTTICEGLAFDPFAFEENGLGPSEIDVGRGEIVEAFVISGMIVVLDERRDLAFEFARQVMVLDQDPAFERMQQSRVGNRQSSQWRLKLSTMRRQRQSVAAGVAQLSTRSPTGSAPASPHFNPNKVGSADLIVVLRQRHECAQ